MFRRDTDTPPPVSPFAHGPYTDAETPETDPATPRPTPEQFKRNIRTASFIALFLVIVGCIIGVAGANGAHKSEPERESLPVCEEEDGSTQKACIFPSERGSIINLDYGRYSYDTTNNKLTDWEKR